MLLVRLAHICVGCAPLSVRAASDTRRRAIMNLEEPAQLAGAWIAAVHVESRRAFWSHARTHHLA